MKVRGRSWEKEDVDVGFVPELAHHGRGRGCCHDDDWYVHVTLFEE